MKSENLCISRLNRDFNREDFSCGIEALDVFLKRHALKNQKQHLSNTWIAHEKDSTGILGFHTLSAASITCSSLPERYSKKIPRYPVPCVLLARFAVDKAYHSQGIGSYLLRDAMNKTIDISYTIGAYALIVDAKNEKARNFYEYYGFIRLPENDDSLFLPINTIIQATQ
ncbi:MAG: GNAT family N-acetyltransferase [Spirochaetales bacterium]|nr:GNAT family N-acetyltransferase [Spirochaetales bacterium]